MKKGEQETIMFGMVVHCLGDKLDQHYPAEFKQGVCVSFQKCRQ